MADQITGEVPWAVDGQSALAALRAAEAAVKRERASRQAWAVEAIGLEGELRRRNREYGRASATIGALRGELARVREELRAARAEIDRERAQATVRYEPLLQVLRVALGLPETAGTATVLAAVESLARDVTAVSGPVGEETPGG